MMNQTVIMLQDKFGELDRYLKESNVHSILLVCGNSIKYLKLNDYFKSLEDRMGIKVIRFSDFTPNPDYESAVKGVRLFHREKCDAIFAVGGGSAMDVAKCIKLFANMDDSKSYLDQKIVPNNIPIFACPTTAGTGSEATKYAVVYYQGEKQSIADDSCIPSMVVMDVSALESLPLYQKKVTMLDALCHAIESFWSINSTDESRKYSKEALSLLWENIQGYLDNDYAGNTKMLQASNIAGKAINITQTTAGHAMCYKLTSLYDIPHGQAAALCVNQLWEYMLKHTDNCMDSRGKAHLQKVFQDIAMTIGASNEEDALMKFRHMLYELNLPEIHSKDDGEYQVLKQSVNPVRLKNHPVKLSEETIENLYHQILRKE